MPGKNETFFGRNKTELAGIGLVAALGVPVVADRLAPKDSITISHEISGAKEVSQAVAGVNEDKPKKMNAKGDVPKAVSALEQLVAAYEVAAAVPKSTGEVAQPTTATEESVAADTTTKKLVKTPAPEDPYELTVSKSSAFEAKPINSEGENFANFLTFFYNDKILKNTFNVVEEHNSKAGTTSFSVSRINPASAPETHVAAENVPIGTNFFVCRIVKNQAGEVVIKDENGNNIKDNIPENKIVHDFKEVFGVPDDEPNKKEAKG